MVVIDRISSLVEAARQRHSTSGLETKIGHRFKNRDLLLLALTHSSSGRENYQRLEFLGDSTLASILKYELFNRSKKREKDLTRLFSQLSSNQTLAEIAREINLGPHIVMSPQEARMGGAEKMNILADVVEAIIGAVRIDGGDRKVYKVVLKLWKTRLDSLPIVAAVDAKSRLQEVSQSLKLGIPVYLQIDRAGSDHAPIFTVEVKVGHKAARGKGPSLKAAQQAAAELLLAKLPQQRPARA